MSQPKPIDALWTDDQWRAISERGSNLLVAAAAGSGKTAVLVERIIRRISDAEAPTDVDRLLVATFTKAAADEMRHRIRDALEQQLAKHKGDEHLARQLALLNKAAITTLHSFCLEIVQTYFYKIPIDPVFRIANETEAELLKSESLEELFEHEYARDDNEAFIRLVDSFGGERSDEAVIRLVLRLYEFSRSHPWPDHWLMETAERFRSADTAAKDLFDQLLRETGRELAGCLVLLRTALDICQEPNGPAPYIETLQSDIDMLQPVVESTEHGDWNRVRDRLDALNFGRLKACRGDSYNTELIEAAKALRNEVKDKVTKLRDEMFLRPAEQYVAELTTLSPVVDALVKLVRGFAERYLKKKQDKGLVDFNDLEHYALAVLRAEASTPDRLIPSEVAEQYRKRFVEVLLDEYQDTNRVQEMIVELISRRDEEGNRFMVGDVKQSIYRFRLAEPGLFLDKYKSYVHQDGGRRIDLSQNFRSRREVVDAVNYVFRQIMYERAAEITYDEAAELKFGAAYYGDTDEQLKVGDHAHDRSGEGADEGDHAAVAAAREDVEPERLQSEQRSEQRSEQQSEQQSEKRMESRQSEPHQGSEKREHAVELLTADRKAWAEYRQEAAAAAAQSEDDSEDASLEDEAVEMETVQIEARMIGLRILELMGKAGKPPLRVYDKSSKSYRAPTYRDIVILLRATQAWAPVMIEELRMMGIPAYADLNSGYFTATEVQVMMSLLKVIDNPLQDIPLAGVLRSPVFRFTAEDLARIRIHSPGGGYYEALKRAARDPDTEMSEAPDFSAVSEQEAPVDDALRVKVKSFLDKLESWRTEARQGTLSELIWRIYRETGYYDLAGGLPGGMQRQANLRALYDRARTYEATSFRGLFRFLRFIERMQDSGADLGTARALGEQEDVVRIMSIHKSKGLEFPVVFVAGLSKQFNEQDLRQSFLLHKDLGLGPKFIDPERRVSLPSLAWLAVRRRLKSEMLAEEMRILYVALTRAREKLILVSSFRDLAKETAKWQRLASGAGATLSDHAVLQARSYADWLFPALIRHPQTNGFAEWGGQSGVQGVLEDRSQWKATLVPVEALLQTAAAVEPRSAEELWGLLEEPLPVHGPERAQHLPLESQAVDMDARSEDANTAGLTSADCAESANKTETGSTGALANMVKQRFDWRYPHQAASAFLSKITVTEIKRLAEQQRFAEEAYEEEAAIDLLQQSSRPRIVLTERPSFMEEMKLTAAERGTAYHTVMQHVPLDSEVTEDSIANLLAKLVHKELLTKEQAEAVDCGQIAGFYRTELGYRMAHADRLYREQPFSYRLPAGEVYREADEAAGEESMLIQGVIDCVFVEQDALVLVDYKTDALRGQSPAKAAEKYDIQLALYARAVADIWRMPVKEAYLYFFDGAHLVNRSHLADDGR